MANNTALDALILGGIGYVVYLVSTGKLSPANAAPIIRTVTPMPAATSTPPPVTVTPVTTVTLPRRFSLKSEAALIGAHPHLVKVIRRAILLSPVDFMITEGRRTLARQRQLVAAGASQTLNSRHITGHAVDVAALVGGKVRWDWPLYAKIAVAVKEAARLEGVPIEWGGDWRTLKDGPHFQLPHKEYP